MRLFVASEIDERVVAQIMAVSDELRRRVEARAPTARLTWVTPERMHLTIRFIGAVDEATADGICASLQSPIDIQPFELAFDGGGFFPDRGAPRVLWIGLARGADELAAVEREVTARLKPHGIPAEDRPYRPHLTLARVRDASNLKPGSLFDDLPLVPDASPVGAITLFQSRSSPKGPTYLRMQSTTLRWKK